MKVPTRPVRGVAPALRESVAWISSLAASSWNRFPKLFQIVPVIGLLAASAGCGQKELSGEAFAMKMVKRGDARREEVVPLAGLPVFFLTESENRRLGTRMSKVQEKIDAELAVKCWKLTNGLRYVAPDNFPSLKTNSLISAYRKFSPDDKRSDEVIFDELVEKGPAKVSEYEDARYHIECQKASAAYFSAKLEVFTAPDSLDFSDTEIAELLNKCQNVTTDSEGKFKIVPRSRDLYVVAKRDKSCWRFRFSAGGQKLIAGVKVFL